MKYSKLSDFKIKKILQCFCLELTAIQAAEQLRPNRHTIERYYTIFREKIANYEEQQIKKFSDSVELVLSGYKHYRINHSKEFVGNHHHINGIESFWSHVKRKMRQPRQYAHYRTFLHLRKRRCQRGRLTLR